MKKHLSLLAGLALLVGAAPAAAVPPTTVDGTIVGDGAKSFSFLKEGPGWPRVARQDITPAQRSDRDTRRRDLLYFAQMSDFQLADEESPSRVEFLDVDSTPFTAAWRPQEALEPFIVDQAIKQINDFAPQSPVAAAKGARASMDFALTTGDSADNQQRNETGWVVKLLEGGRLNPNSGVEGSCPGAPAGEAARYTGVQDYTDYFADGNFYDPNTPLGRYSAWPSYPALMDRAEQPFDAAGLKVPSYVTFGNHDGLAQGNQAANGATEGIGTGCLKAFAPVDVRNLTPELLTAGPTIKPVPADPDRRYVTKPEYRALHAGAGHQGDAHGFSFIDKAQSQASANRASYYDWSPKPGFRFVALDTVCDGGVAGPSADGNIDDPQFQWLTKTIETAEKRGELIILFGHHPVRSLTCVVPDEVAPPCIGPNPQQGGHDVNPGCDADPRTSTPIHRGADLQSLLLAHPSVITYVAGHTHEHRITPFKGAKGGFWGIETSSETDWPIQSRLLDVMDNRDGTISIFGTLIDVAGGVGAPASGTAAAGLSTDQLATIGRTLSANDPQNGLTTGIGTPPDRNVELLLPTPPDATLVNGSDPDSRARAAAIIRKLRLKVSGVCKRKVTLSIGGKTRKEVRAADFFNARKKRVGRDKKPPLRVRVLRRRLGKRGRRVRLSARVTLLDGNKGTVSRRLRLCKRR